MSQAFEGAQPQVLRAKPKYKPAPPNSNTQGFYDESDPEAREALNIMHDKRIFRGNTHNMNLIQANMTAQQKDELRIKEEQERKKIEMIKFQLLQYKKQKHKPSPYDLVPGPPARIEVDLGYFLTEQGRAKPEDQDVKCQTDVFLPRPETPQYVPKKTGIDKITQIEDYDLFDYDREVQPILNVLLTKTVEQSLLEVEEETELEEIRKYKQEYKKRQVDLRDSWEEEVKREIQRIKHKNRDLKNARARREQQIKTMHKLQSLNMSKQFLSGCFKGTLTHLSQSNYWRDSFQDQLNIAYKHFMTDKAQADSQQAVIAEGFINQALNNELQKLSDTKSSIKKAAVKKAELQKATRVIESTDKRIVHFVFDPKQKVQQTPFAKKFNQWLAGTMKEDEETEHAAFDEYIEKWVEDTLAEGEHNPIVFEENQNEELVLNGIDHISWAVANNPFFKLEIEKYYPTAVIVNKEGKVLGQYGACYPQSEKQAAEFPNCRDRHNFRDDKIRINDDRKVEFKTQDFKDSSIQVFLMVRTFDLRKEKDMPENLHDDAWFRLQNEQTSQTLDYTKIKKIDVPEDYAEGSPEDESPDLDEEERKSRNELVYLAGRIYCETSKSGQHKWIYEKWNQLVETQKYPNLDQSLADLYKHSCDESAGYDEQINQAQMRMSEAAEEKRAAQIAAASKKQAKGSKKKGKDEDNATPAPEEPRQGRSS